MRLCHDFVSPRSKSCPRRRSSPWTSRDKLGISGVSTRLQLADLRVRACPPAASTAMGERKARDKE
eukprot:7389880-Prymnesium_polylepis.1